MSHTFKDRRRLILGPDGKIEQNVLFNSPAQDAFVPDTAAELGSFQGADTISRDRGYVWVPTLDTLKEVDAWSHTELLRRGRFVYNSGGGLVHRAVNGVARMVCGTGLFPYPLSKDKKWNKKLRQLWAQQCESKNTFDLSRKQTCASAQQAIVRSKYRDGDVAAVLARDESNRLRAMFYEAHQIGMGSTRVDPGQRWHHGVQLNQHSAPLAYRILSDDTGSGLASGHADIPAQNVLFCAEYERFGQARGLSRFYPCINQVLDRGEIYAAVTKGIKMREQIGYAIEQQLATNQVPTNGRGTLAPRPTTKIDLGNGREISLEKFFGGGESVDLQPGQTFKVIESDHPNENVREHLSNLERSIAASLDWSVELLWNIQQLGGANTRFIMADAQSKIEVEQQALVEQFLGPWYLAWVRDMIEAGMIWEVADWELHTWLLPKRLTVDFGRDGKLHLEQYKRGMITMKSLYGFVGDEWQPEIDQYLDERQYIKDGLTSNGRNLTWAEAYPEIGGSTLTAQYQAEEAEPTPDNEEIEQRLEALERAVQDKPFRLN